MTDQPHPERATEAFFGRRKGKHLKSNHHVALAEVLPKLKLDLTKPAPDNFMDLWNISGKSTRLEIGFGGGEHLLHRARSQTDTCFIGVEPFVNSMAKLARSVFENPIDNLRLYDDDATLVLDWLPDNSIDHIDLLYPDPWPKRRHWKRRFVSTVNLDRFSRVLKPGGKFCFASDIDTYVNWTLEHINAHPDFSWIANGPDDWTKSWDGWPSTRYEAKAFREGRTPAYLDFIRH
jgi:tRNA (guanine-N7-)-methyltransferase